MLFSVAYAGAAAGGLVLVWNLYLSFLILPDEANQGPVYRIMFFHIPAWWTAFLCVAIAALASIMYLVRKNLRWDSIAVAATEVGVAFLLVGITLGSILGTGGVGNLVDMGRASHFRLTLCCFVRGISCASEQH